MNKGERERRSSEENVLIVPIKKLRGGVEVDRFWQDDRLSMGGIILMPILEFFLDAAADLQAVFRRHCNIAPVKERVHILAKQNPVGYGVWSPFAVRFDVGRFENVQNG